ncbi:jg16312 [Pararge aegeria aegeria]|uniref:Jg16312 protein n=1 Tax=Pararge aegeria aegeria TaxID=348720 RepID=A0A8S4RTI6_9NEOP|nr:jg16312 [Pararge aegeria aegeria]
MPELGPMMRALELQRLIENKVSEWRERSARVAGASVAESYQQPLHFKRHTNRRKNSAEINRIIAKYSRPNKRPDERRFTVEKCPEEPPVRPARYKKFLNKFSRSEDNLANIGVMDTHPDPTEETIKAPPRSKLSKYKTKSCEDITAFVDLNHTMKSKIFEENSILNAKAVSKERHTLHSIGEDSADISEFEDSGISFRHKPNFLTSTPISNRKTCPAGDSVSVFEFEKCAKYSSVCDLQKGSSVPDIHKRISVGSANTLDARKRWKLIKPPFRKGTFDCLLRWRGKKPTSHRTK